MQSKLKLDPALFPTADQARPAAPTSCLYFSTLTRGSHQSPHCTFKEWHGIVADGNGEDRNVRGQMAESVNARCEVISVYRPCGRAANAPASPGRQRASIDRVKWTSP